MFKHIDLCLYIHLFQNRFYFSKTKGFMFQRLISEHRQTPASKCAIPENIQTGQGGRGVEDILFLKNPGIFKFVTLPLEILEKAKLHLWIFHKVVWHPFFSIAAGNSTSF